MMEAGTNLIGAGAAVLSLLTGILALAAGVVYACGIPIAAAYWYQRIRTPGRFLVAVGFAVNLVGGILGWVAVKFAMFVGLHHGLPFYLFEGPLALVGLSIALAGFALVVLREDKYVGIIETDVPGQERA